MARRTKTADRPELTPGNGSGDADGQTAAYVSADRLDFDHAAEHSCAGVEARHPNDDETACAA